MNNVRTPMQDILILATSARLAFDLNPRMSRERVGEMFAKIHHAALALQLDAAGHIELPRREMLPTDDFPERGTEADPMSLTELLAKNPCRRGAERQVSPLHATSEKALEYRVEVTR